jgi:HEAT repeat protein
VTRSVVAPILTVLLVLAAAPALAQEAEVTPVPADLDQRTNDELWGMACLWQVGSNRDVVPAAREALVRRGPAILDWLIPDKLDASSTLVTRALTDVVRGVGAAEAVPRLLPQLEHENAAVRRNAATLLGDLDAAEAAPAIAGLLGDPEARLGALAALARLKAQDAVPSIAALARGDAPERVRFTAVSTLGGIGGPDAERVLVTELGNEDAPVRFAAQYALEKLDAVDAFRSALDSSDHRVRLHALAGLGRIGDQAARRDVLRFLGDPDPVTRGFAADALGAMLTDATRAILERAREVETDSFARTKMEQALDR